MAGFMSVVVEGLDDLARKSAALRGAVSPAVLGVALVAGGKIIESAAKQNMGGPGPNRDTGDLSRSITTELRGLSVHVGTDKVYGAIQELGGTIEAKNAPYLVFQTDDGQWHSVKSVTLPPRPYLRPAFDENAERVVDVVGQAVELVIRRAAAA